MCKQYPATAERQYVKLLALVARSGEERVELVLRQLVDSGTLHFNVTAYPTAAWTARQVAEAFPWDSAPGYLLHDRDCIYGAAFQQRVAEIGIREVLTAPRCPWQNAYAERFIGSLRRECLDHIIIFNESSLRRVMKAYFEYYEHSRTHLG